MKEDINIIGSEQDHNKVSEVLNMMDELNAGPVKDDKIKVEWT
ncbi:hypothetical protein [Oceanobacillus profundus]|nr:hypothetical protein [Oceanobacillus profundus]